MRIDRQATHLTIFITLCLMACGETQDNADGRLEGHHSCEVLACQQHDCSLNCCINKIREMVQDPFYDWAIENSRLLLNDNILDHIIDSAGIEFYEDLANAALPVESFPFNTAKYRVIVAEADYLEYDRQSKSLFAELPEGRGVFSSSSSDGENYLAYYVVPSSVGSKKNATVFVGYRWKRIFSKKLFISWEVLVPVPKTCEQKE